LLTQTFKETLLAKNIPIVRQSLNHQANYKGRIHTPLSFVLYNEDIDANQFIHLYNDIGARLPVNTTIESFISDSNMSVSDLTRILSSCSSFKAMKASTTVTNYANEQSTLNNNSHTPLMTQASLLKYLAREQHLFKSTILFTLIEAIDKQIFKPWLQVVQEHAKELIPRLFNNVVAVEELLKLLPTKEDKLAFCEMLAVSSNEGENSTTGIHSLASTMLYTQTTRKHAIEEFIRTMGSEAFKSTVLTVTNGEDQTCIEYVNELQQQEIVEFFAQFMSIDEKSSTRQQGKRTSTNKKKSRINDEDNKESSESNGKRQKKK